MQAVPRHASRRGARPAAGFTLIELLLVLVLIAMSSGLISLALRDSDASRLDHEAMRLAALLEAGRAASRASGFAVAFALTQADSTAGDDFRFLGMPPGTTLPTRWLTPGVQAQLPTGGAVVLGPEPLIGAQRIVLRLGEQQLALVSDGLGPFVPEGGVPR
jgi:general secretion pathway protein H